MTFSFNCYWDCIDIIPYIMIDWENKDNNGIDVNIGWLFCEFSINIK